MPAASIVQSKDAEVEHSREQQEQHEHDQTMTHEDYGAANAADNDAAETDAPIQTKADAVEHADQVQEIIGSKQMQEQVDRNEAPGKGSSKKNRSATKPTNTSSSDASGGKAIPHSNSKVSSWLYR